MPDSGFLDDVAIDIPCPNCGCKHSKTIGWINRNSLIRCRGCGISVRLDVSQLRQEMRKIDKSFKDLQREFDRINRSFR